MKSIKTQDCALTSNTAFDGFAIYIEGDDKGTTFTITGSNFTSNSDKTINSKNRGAIITEIQKLLDLKLETTNIFNPISVGVKVNPVVFVDHTSYRTNTRANIHWNHL